MKYLQEQHTSFYTTIRSDYKHYTALTVSESQPCVMIFFL